MGSKEAKQIAKNKFASKSETEKKEIVRLNLNVSKPFYRKIKQRALDEDTTITELVIKAIEDYLVD